LRKKRTYFAINISSFNIKRDVLFVGFEGEIKYNDFDFYAALRSLNEALSPWCVLFFASSRVREIFHFPGT